MKPAVLALEDGSIFRGTAFGADTDAEGEVVFNTAMSGYQEVLTDPSYRGQIVVMTAPQIGNTGINADDFESRRCFCAGFIVRDLSPVTSSWRAQGSLDDLMREHGVSGLGGIDTRALTRKLRISGSLRGLITTQVPKTPAEEAELGRRAAAVPSLEGRDLVKEVTTDAVYTWDQPSYRFAGEPAAPPADVHVVAYDFGIKRNILHRLRDHGCRVTVVPARTPAKEALAHRPDGVFLSNGPADPAAVTYGIEATRDVIAAGVPLFGICLGHQILGLALGGRTFKLKFGHHGANHPVLEVATGKVEITSQNHGFCVDMDSLAGKATLTHVNLNDRTVEGMAVPGKPVFSVQYHPEASPGPHDASYLFRRFLAHVRGDVKSAA
jgi:carbamoyl-phosphate synthase small subunit